MKYAMPAICGSLLTTKADQWKKLINPNSQSETKQMLTHYKNGENLLLSVICTFIG